MSESERPSHLSDSPDSSDVPAPSRRRPLFGGKNKTIWIIALVAVVCIGVGYGMSQLITSPAQAAANAEAPAAQNITAPVEMRTLSNEVVLRGDVTYDDPAPIKIQTGEVKGPAVVTGHLPAVGDVVEQGGVLLEIVGRPVIALPGNIAVYRTLRIGTQGPDVLQLKQALQGLGIDPGNVASDVFDAATAAAVTKLYANAGYPAPSASDEEKATSASAQSAVAAAERNLAAAKTALGKAGGGPGTVETLTADAAVNQAQRTLDSLATAYSGQAVTDAQNAYNAAVASGNDAAIASAASELDAAKAAHASAQTEYPAAQDALAIAKAQRAQLGSDVTTTAEQQAVTAAQDELRTASEARDKAAEALQPYLPASEVVYVKSLPRRVDSVSATMGVETTGSDVMTLSGATLQVSASVSKADAALLKAGDVATLSGSGIKDVTATVTSIEAQKAGAGDGSSDKSGDNKTSGDRFTVTFALSDLTDEQRTAITGTNVKLTIPIASTGGDVKAVPIAGLSMGPSGNSRVEVQRTDGSTELIDVETGLSASGFAEIKSSTATIEAGDLIVVGK